MALERRWFVAAFPFVLAVLACGSGQSQSAVPASAVEVSGFPGNQAHPRLQVYGADIGRTWANVSVLQDGVPVNDASVVVNGEVIPSATAEAGFYSGPLASALSTGDRVLIEVTRGPSVVTGKGAMPDEPVLTSPSPGATFAPGEDVVVTWTSPVEPEYYPDYFVVSATWSCGTGCGTGVRFDVDRAARSFTIPAGALPSGKDVVLRVFAYDDGKLRRNYEPYAPYPGMNIRADSDPVTVTVSAVAQPNLVVFGCDMGAYWENVCVMRDGAAVTDAAVLVDGTALSHGSDGWYHGSLPSWLPPGATLALQVTSGASVVTGTGTVPEAPVLTWPLPDSTFDPGTGVLVTWTSATSPDYFSVVASWSCGTGCGTGQHFDVGPAARSFTIAAGVLPTDRPVELHVFAYDDGALSGDYTPASWYPGMNIRAESGSVTVTAAPHPKLEVFGSDMSAAYQNVRVMRDGVPVNDALVLVNDTVIPLHLDGHYHGVLPAMLAQGDMLSLEVRSGVSVVTGSGTIPETPVMTSPATGAIFETGNGIPVLWTSTTDPDYFTVVAQWSCGPSCGTGRFFEVDPWQRSFTIPASELPADRPIEVAVFAYEDGAFAGDYVASSWYPGMNIRAESAGATVSY